MRAIALLICLASGASAQEVPVDRETVEACFETGRAEAGGLPSCVGDAAARCQERPGGGTTLGISNCLMAETGVWAALMQEAYDQKLDTLRETDESLPEALRQSQEAWATYRDAACGLQYSIWLEGSIRVIIAGNCHLRKTAGRALELSGLGELD